VCGLEIAPKVGIGRLNAADLPVTIPGRLDGIGATTPAISPTARLSPARCKPSPAVLSW
jgi:hypothetical protein